ncbi:MAG: hypothetical protein RSO15_09850 [Bacteroides sp.]|uniref:hypothetical protein n=1 Tax=Bacteroides sp. TaxID=29523 RepID=UPI002FC7A2A6
MNEKKYLTAQEASQLSESFTNLPDVFSQIKHMCENVGERKVHVRNHLKEDEIETLRSLGYKVSYIKSYGRFLIEW